MTQFHALAESLVSAGLFTLTTHITGDIRMRQRRLTDYLASLEEQFIMVERAKLEVLADTQLAPHTAPFAQVNRETIVFAMPYSGEGPVDDSELRRMVMVVKVPKKVAVSAPPFIITGYMHLLRETNLRDALLAVRQAFLPLTNAEAVYSPTNQRFPAPILMVNRMRIEAFYPAEEG
jgi:hypothetical protein